MFCLYFYQFCSIVTSFSSVRRNTPHAGRCPRRVAGARSAGLSISVARVSPAALWLGFIRQVLGYSRNMWWTFLVFGESQGTSKSAGIGRPNIRNVLMRSGCSVKRDDVAMFGGGLIICWSSMFLTSNLLIPRTHGDLSWLPLVVDILKTNEINSIKGKKSAIQASERNEIQLNENSEISFKRVCVHN